MKPLKRHDSEKWNLWPWKHWMTIGIGALCSEGIEMLIVPPDREPILLLPSHPEHEGCPVSLTEMKALFEKYGPQGTEHLELREPVNHTNIGT